VKTPLATFRCGHCRDDGRKAERVGRTLKMPDGRTVWIGYDVELAHRMRKENPDLSFSTARSYHTLAWPGHSIAVPDAIDVWCRRHDHGPVATSDVAGKRGIIFLYFKAAV